MKLQEYRSTLKRSGYKKICKIADYMLSHPDSFIIYEYFEGMSKISMIEGLKKNIRFSRMLTESFYNEQLRSIFLKVETEWEYCIRKIDPVKYNGFKEKYKRFI